MPQETTMTFRIDSELRTQFIATAKKMNIPAAQILRALMVNFIQNKQSTNQYSIPIEEQETRRKAVDFANASAALEGYSITDSERQHAQRYISGEIDLEAFVSGTY